MTVPEDAAQAHKKRVDHVLAWVVALAVGCVFLIGITIEDGLRREPIEAVARARSALLWWPDQSSDHLWLGPAALTVLAIYVRYAWPHVWPAPLTALSGWRSAPIALGLGLGVLFAEIALIPDQGGALILDTGAVHLDPKEGQERFQPWSGAVSRSVECRRYRRKYTATSYLVRFDSGEEVELFAAWYTEPNWWVDAMQELERVPQLARLPKEGEAPSEACLVLHEEQLTADRRAAFRALLSPAP